MNSDCDLYYSVKLRRNLAECSVTVPPGAAHYSYSAVASKFLNSFKSAGFIPIEIDRPEIYMAPPISNHSRAVHVMFKPYQEFRLLKRTTNIAHVAWEFEDLPRRESWPIGDERRRDPFADYVHMLRIPQHIWVGSNFTKSIFEKFGIKNVDLVPAPIFAPMIAGRDFDKTLQTIAQVGRLHLSQVKCIQMSENVIRNPETVVFREHTAPVSSLIRNDRTVFLLVANPGDLRKNLPALIDGFSIAAQKDPSLVLIIKLTIDNHHVTLKSVLRDGLPKLYQNNEMAFGDVAPCNIFVITEFLTQEQLEAIYCCSDFYLSAAIAEGQNLPLQEAMAFGVIPVCGNHTAMNDYVTADNGVLMNWQQQPATFAFEQAYGMRAFKVPFISAEEVCNAAMRASQLSVRERQLKRSLAAMTIREGYGEEVISERIRQLLESYD